MARINSFPNSSRAWSDSKNRQASANGDQTTRTSTLITLQSLEKVDASTLPAKVLVLLSKYATALKNHNGIVIQLSSLNVFRNVHHTSLLCDDALVQKLHRQLLIQVRSHVQLGSMYLTGQKPTDKATKNQESVHQKSQKVALDLLVRKSPYNKASSAAKQSNLQNNIENSMSALN